MKTTINTFYKKGCYGLLALFLFAAPALSQDCNGTYESGLSLLKKRTEAAVKDTVRKFESAKRCYKVNRDEQGVRNCDEQIAACNQLLNYYAQQAARETPAEESFEFPASGNEQTIPVKTKRNWTFSDSHDWCTATKVKEGLKVVVDPNPSTVRRTQTLTLKWPGGKRLIKIVQEGEAEKLALSEYDLFFQADDVEKKDRNNFELRLGRRR
ncbi:MAG: BACON domain-containing protein [Parabacteroides sp.]|nr:BACON domain-containing protein [Parabacteroides sp.]